MSTRIILEDDEIPETKGFRFASQRVLLTYKTHLDKQQFKLHALTWGLKTIQDDPYGKTQQKRIIIAHETGKADSEHPYEHTHALIDFGKVFKTENCRYFDIMGIHPNISPVLKKNWIKALKYVSKEDKDAQLQVKEDEGGARMIVENILNAETLKDAICDNMQGLTDVGGIEKIFHLRSTNICKRFHWKPDMQWQDQFIREFAEGKRYNHRQVTWITDRKGGMGKTCLSKWLSINYPGDWLITSDMGTSRDAATVVSNALEGGWNCHGCIINLTRSAEIQKHNRIYMYLEQIKDGMMTSQKYSGRAMVFDSPHLIVFSNWEPDLEALSYDRWDIREIGEDGRMIGNSQLSHHTAYDEISGHSPEKAGAACNIIHDKAASLSSRQEKEKEEEEYDPITAPIENEDEEEWVMCECQKLWKLRDKNHCIICGPIEYE